MKKHLALLMITFFSADYSLSAALETHADARSVVLDFDLASMALSFPRDEVEAQNRLSNNLVNFRVALEQALINISADYSNKESPLAMLIEDSFHELDIAPTLPLNALVLEYARAKLKHFMNRSSTLLALVTSNPARPVFPPEHGEHLSQNWIFFLSIPEYSDHLHWIIVDRQGNNGPYTYGFN